VQVWLDQYFTSSFLTKIGFSLPSSNDSSSSMDEKVALKAMDFFFGGSQIMRYLQKIA